MKILLVLTELNVKYGIYGFQHGLAALSAYLKKHGYQDITFCHLYYRYKVCDFRRIVRRQRPDIIGFYTTHDQFRFIKKLLCVVPEDCRAFTICGGPHATLNPDIIYEHPRLDAVCVGEGEEVFLELAKKLEKGKSPIDIPGLWVRDNGCIKKNSPRPFIQDIDSLPAPDREIFSASNPFKRIGLTGISYQNSFRIGRGCPYGCKFCSNEELGNAQKGTYLRFRSVGKVLEEIGRVKERYSLGEVYFEDDTFTLKSAFIDEFCEKYPSRIGLPFEFFSHIEDSTFEILEKLRRAGGRRVSFGVESGNEKLRRDLLGKDFSNKEIIEVFKEAGKMGYETEAFVMAGLPDETPEKFRETAELLRKIQPNLYSLSIYFPFKGTALYRQACERGYIEKDFEVPDDFISRRDTLLRMPDFARGEILASVKRFGWDVYRDRSLLKAALFRLYETPLGDIFLRLFAPYKRLIRRMAVK